MEVFKSHETVIQIIMTTKCSVVWVNTSHTIVCRTAAISGTYSQPLNPKRLHLFLKLSAVRWSKQDRPRLIPIRSELICCDMLFMISGHSGRYHTSSFWRHDSSIVRNTWPLLINLITVVAVNEATLAWKTPNQVTGWLGCACLHVKLVRRYVSQLFCPIEEYTDVPTFDFEFLLFKPFTVQFAA